MSRVLVTGASGFMGRHCLPALAARGYEVHAVGRRTGSDPGVTWHRGDLLAPEGPEAVLAAVRPTHLLHLAWYAEHGRFWQAPENLAWVRASLSLLEAFHRHGGQRVVTAGSCAEYDWRHGYLSEALTPCRPASLYGAAKHALSTLQAAYAEQVGLSAAWGRVFFLFGPHEPHARFVPAVIQGLMAGRPTRLSHGRQVRDFMYVGDVADALVALLDSPVTGAVNLGSGVPVTLRALGERVAARLGGAEWLEWGAIASTEAPLVVANPERLAREVGWTPPYGLEAGLDATLAWWHAQELA